MPLIILNEKCSEFRKFLAYFTLQTIHIIMTSFSLTGIQSHNWQILVLFMERPINVLWQTMNKAQNDQRESYSKRASEI